METVLPKVELHVHLDCCLSYDAVRTLQPSVSERQYREEFVAPRRCTNLADFLTRAPKGFGLMQDEASLRLVTADLFRQFHADNVIYGEIRFAPLLHLAGGLTPEEVVEIVNDAVVSQIRDTGIEARIILCTLRHFSAEQSLQTAKLVQSFRDTHVVALDLAGDEAGYPLTQHVGAFEFARQNKLYLTAHAGEARGADSVRETLRLLQPTRIGHGVRSTEDPELLDQLRQSNIHLEVCPSSNLQTNIYPAMAEHVLDQLYRAGLSVSINTDARTITDITLEEEYENLRKAFGWKDHDFTRCNLNALEASFIPDDLKRTLSARIRSAK